MKIRWLFFSDIFSPFSDQDANNSTQSLAKNQQAGQARAKAPQRLSKPGELLISYNVNSFYFLEDIKYKPHHVRPRFFTVKY